MMRSGTLGEVDDLLGRHSPVELLDNVDLVCWDLFIDDNSVPSESSAQFTKCSPVLVVASYFHRVLSSSSRFSAPTAAYL